MSKINNTEIFEKYAALKAQIAPLEKELEKLKPQIIAVMQEVETEEVVLPVGTITLASRRNWTYPAHLEILEEELLAKQKEAEQTGEAEYVEVFYPKFKAK